jgi:hypothetical protein
VITFQLSILVSKKDDDDEEEEEETKLTGIEGRRKNTTKFLKIVAPLLLLVYWYTVYP